MSLYRVWRTLRAWITQLWPEDADERLEAKADRFRRLLRRRYRGLVRRRREIEVLRERLERLGRQEKDRRWSDPCRNAGHVRLRLERRQQDYQERLAEVAALRQRVATLQEAAGERGASIP